MRSSRFFYRTQACRMTSCNRFRSIDSMQTAVLPHPGLHRGNTYLPLREFYTYHFKSKFWSYVRPAKSAKIEGSIKKWKEHQDITIACIMSFGFVDGIFRINNGTKISTNLLHLCHCINLLMKFEQIRINIYICNLFTDNCCIKLYV